MATYYSNAPNSGVWTLWVAFDDHPARIICPSTLAKRLQALVEGLEGVCEVKAVRGYNLHHVREVECLFEAPQWDLARALKQMGYTTICG